MESTRRHRRIAKLQLKLAGIATGILLSITALFGGVQTHQNSEARAAVEQATQNSTFWRIIAGTEAPSTSPSSQLATRLRDLLREDADPSTGLPKAITEFRVNANTYGRVDSELGFQPFDNTGLNCTTCGTLNEYMLNQLRTIKQGGIEQIVSQALDVQQVSGLTLSPFGMPMLLWGAVAYLTITTGALMFAVRRDSTLHNYLQSELNWKNSGGTEADKYKTISKAISPGYVFIVLPFKRKRGKDYQKVLREINLARSYETLREALKGVDALPAGEQAQARSKIEQLLADIDDQVSSKVNADKPYRPDKTDELRAYIRETVDSASLNIHIREEALDDLDKLESGPMSESQDPSNHRCQQGQTS